MAHITLSIPNNIYDEMKQHPEIKWSELAREKFKEYLKQMTIVRGSDLMRMLPKETQKTISETPLKKAAEFAKAVEREGWKRVKSLTQAS